MKLQYKQFDDDPDWLSPADREYLTRAAEANWFAARTQEPGASAPVGNTSSVNTGDAVSRVTRNWSKYHE